VQEVGVETTKVQKAEHRNVNMRAAVEHPLCVGKPRFGRVKVRLRGLAKNTAHVVALFALSNLGRVRKLRRGRARVTAFAQTFPGRVVSPSMSRSWSTCRM
jgi:IS5 family transposase